MSIVKIKSKSVDVLQLEAKLLRDSSIAENITEHGVEWQVRDTIDLANIQDAIDEAEYENLPPETTIEFILADNTIRETTAQELREVKSAYRKRKMAIFEDYKAWRAGPMDEPFEL